VPPVSCRLRSAGRAPGCGSAGDPNPREAEVEADVFVPVAQAAEAGHERDHVPPHEAMWMPSAVLPWRSCMSTMHARAKSGSATPRRRGQHRVIITPPYFFARATVTGVHSAVHGRALRVHARCLETCVARVALQAKRQSKWFGWPTEFGFARRVFNRHETAVFVIRVPQRLRSRLDRRLRDGRLRIRVLATDRAGNADGGDFSLVDD
jgi:hypothetical protein